MLGKAQVYRKLVFPQLKSKGKCNGVAKHIVYREEMAFNLITVALNKRNLK